MLKEDQLTLCRWVTLARHSCAKTSDVLGEWGIHKQSWMNWLWMQELGFPRQNLSLVEGVCPDEWWIVVQWSYTTQCHLDRVSW